MEAMDLTVRVFSTSPVQNVELRGSGARLRLCARCAAQPLAGPVTVSAAGEAGGFRVSVGGHVAPAIYVEGEVRASVTDGRVAQVAGRWRVAGAADGLHVTVEVPSERYVMAVLQGEAAPDEPVESLKALAVVARSFALRNPQRHGLEGLCDSTHCQALRFAPVPARVREAVEATAGETLWVGAAGSAARQVEGYFTQACGGTTEDAAALWGGGPKPWLVAHADPYCAREPALWHAELGLEQVREALAAEGIAVPAVIRSVEVSERDGSGRAAVLEVKAAVTGTGRRSSGAEGPASDAASTNRRKLIPFEATRAEPVRKYLVRAATLRFALDRAFGWNELRSDWYRVSVAGGRVLFEGRGYGHGVGLCQAGARAMAAQGKGYREILGFYFPGTSVRVLPDDAGWASRKGNGWTLRAVSEGNEWIAAGDAAWARARAVFPRAQAAQPVVTVSPTTELFREATGEPGWELGVTRGSWVTVQPEGVVDRESVVPTPRAKGGRDEWATHGIAGLNARQELLLHEFLHVLVEREAGDQAPLWLREGLVEVLAGERCAAGAEAGVSSEAMEAGLLQAGSQAESQRAHAAACTRVRGLADRYGLAAVRGWLRNGVPAGAFATQ